MTGVHDWRSSLICLGGLFPGFIFLAHVLLHDMYGYRGAPPGRKDICMNTGGSRRRNVQGHALSKDTQSTLIISRQYKHDTISKRSQGQKTEMLHPPLPSTLSQVCQELHELLLWYYSARRVTLSAESTLPPPYLHHSDDCSIDSTLLARGGLKASFRFDVQCNTSVSLLCARIKDSPDGPLHVLNARACCIG